MRLAAFIAAGMVGLVAAPVPSTAQAPARGMTTATLAEACGLEARDLAGATAAGYCRGFMAGAGQYHREISVDRPPIFCLSPGAEGAPTAQGNWAFKIHPSGAVTVIGRKLPSLFGISGLIAHFSG